MKEKMKKEFIILFFISFTLLSCQKKQNENKTILTNEQKSINKNVVESNETQSGKGLSDKWIIDLSIYNDVPEDSFITYISLHLNKENYSLGYHFQGGTFAYGKYTIENNKVFLNYPENIREDSDTYTYLLNKIFPDKENQVLTYDSNYKSLAYSGCLRNKNSIFADMNNPSSVNEEYDFEGIKVIKLETYNAYSKETMKLRVYPSTTAEIGGGLERATLPFSGFQRAEPFGGYEVEKKSGESFLLGKVSFARAFRNGIDKGSRGYALAQ